MKISRSVFPAVFAAIWPFCAAAQSLEPDPPSPLGRFVLGASQHEPVQATPWRAIVATQNRINRYFHRDVAPKLRGCWDALEGSGTVDAQFAYRRVGGRWVNNGILIRASTLPKNQDQAALRCLQEAVRDTSFAVERSDDTAMDFEVNWSFPVPWPKDVAEAAKRMVDNGHTDDGGCGGSEGPGPLAGIASMSRSVLSGSRIAEGLAPVTATARRRRTAAARPAPSTPGARPDRSSETSAGSCCTEPCFAAPARLCR